MSSPSSGDGPPTAARRTSVSSRRWRAASLRRASTSRRVATVASHARGSRGGCSGHTRSASSSASCSASSAASKSSPRRTRPASTRGTRARRAPSSSCRVGSSITPDQSSDGASDMISRTSIHSYRGSPRGAGLGGDVRGELERALAGLDVDHVPARDQVAGLGVRAVGGDGRGVRAAVAHPGARRRERLRVDVLAALLQQLADVPLEGHVRLHVLGRPLVHRREGMVRLRAAAVVLEKQVLRHGGLLVSWAAPVVALHLVSGASRSFSTWNHSSTSSETVG